MPCFQWLNMAPPGAAVDLRAMGWGLCQDDRCADCVTLVGAATLRLSQWRDLMRDAAQGLRRRALVLGVGEGDVRARVAGQEVLHFWDKRFCITLEAHRVLSSAEN